MEILEIVVLHRPVVKQVGPIPVDHKDTVLHRKRTGLVTDLPVSNVFAIEERDKAGVISCHSSERENEG